MFANRDNFSKHLSQFKKRHDELVAEERMAENSQKTSICCIFMYIVGIHICMWVNKQKRGTNAVVSDN